MFEKRKTLVSCVVTAQLICVFVFAYAKSLFSHDVQGMSFHVLHIFSGFGPHSGRHVSLSKIHLPPKSTGNTQEAVAPSRHD